ncbi:hypothetical protein MBLNU459_g5372t1 [Dothideomycetes sp. NU459]
MVEKDYASRPPAVTSSIRQYHRPPGHGQFPPRKPAPSRKPLSELPNIAPNTRHSSTPNLLSYIPPHLSPLTTSALLTELSKPISPHDEAGYIYIFWLTDTSATPSKATATSLLTPPTPTRRISDVLSEYSYAPAEANAPRTIKLKIGRANNVHRRMNEWTRQCGYTLSLVRWYPYVPSSSSSSPSSPASSPVRYPDLTLRPGTSARSPASPERRRSDQDVVRKVPHAHRVERLVHLELADKRVKRDCGACGREHREWFEIEATQRGVQAVDEVVRRWVRWAETLPSGS